MIEAIFLLLGLIGALWAVALLGNLRKRVGELEGRIDALTAGREPTRASLFEGDADAPAPVRRRAPSVPLGRQVERDEQGPAATEVFDADPADGFPDPEQALSVGQAPDDPAPTPGRAENLAGLFERFVGGRLLVWTGGIAIALAGLFLVRYSIERGLISPAARMMAAAVFGMALVGAGEAARRRVPEDPRFGQALAGAGVLVLYAAAYGAHVLYGLIGLGTAFALMAAVAVGALVLSLRHGTPAAVLGLVAGFATPLLVGDVTVGAVPLLGYLALLNAAVFAVAMFSERLWLASAARLLTMLWTGSLLFSAPGDALTTGLFVLVYTVAACAALRDADDPYPSSAAGLALLQLTLVVALADHHWRGWALFLALCGAGFGLGSRFRGLRSLPHWGLYFALVLLLSHYLTAPRSSLIALYAASVTSLFCAGSWLRFPGEAPLRWTAVFCAGAAGPAMLLRLVSPELTARPVWGALLAGLALAPAAWAWRIRDRAREDAPFDGALLLAGATAVALLCAAALDLVAANWLPLAWMAAALGALHAARRIGDGGWARLAVLVASAAALAAAARAPAMWETLAAALAGVPALTRGLPSPGTAAVLFAAPALMCAALWRGMPSRERELARYAGWLAAALGGLFGYVVFKQLFALGTPADFAARGFAERTVLTQGLFFAGWLLAVRPRIAWLGPIAWALTAIAAARFAWFDLVVLNALFIRQNVGALPILNLVAPAFLGSAFWLWEARRRARTRPVPQLTFAGFLAALIAGAGLIVRQLFHGAFLVGGDVPRAEFYGYSLAGLLVSVGLLLWGWRRGDTPLRVAGLAFLAATVVKVFAVDAAALEGVLRIASFFGLGVALLGMGKLYATLLGRSPSTASQTT